MSPTETESSTAVLEPPAKAAEPSSIRFPRALPGLDDAHEWQLAELPEAPPFLALRSCDRPPLTLLVVDPRAVVEGYAPEVPASALRQLEADSVEGCVLLTTVTAPPGDEPTVNLRAPIVINPQRMLGTQIILDDARWSVRHALTPAEPEGQGGPDHAGSQPQDR